MRLLSVPLLLVVAISLSAVSILGCGPETQDNPNCAAGNTLTNFPRCIQCEPGSCPDGMSCVNQACVITDAGGSGGTGGVGGDTDAGVLDGGGTDGGVADGSVDANIDAPMLPCGVECVAPNPHCHESSMTCVQCLVTDDCDTGVCDPASHTCVTCTAAEGCQSPQVCDVPNHTCVECNNSTDCTAPDVCITGGHGCVECNAPSDCTADADLTQCADNNTCVQCINDSDCTDPAASKCSNNECVACDNNTQCAGKTNGSIAVNVCDTSDGPGQCVQCTATNETACGNNSCNPANTRCTNTPRTSVGTCGACRADSECLNAQARCVPMNFNGTPREGGYCLRRKGDTDCTRPYRVLITATSLSGQPAEEYCGIDQALTTCEAVLDMTNDTGCTLATDCGASGLNDGLCQTVGGAANKCTYACNDAAQCNSSRTCADDTPYCH